MNCKLPRHCMQPLPCQFSIPYQQHLLAALDGAGKIFGRAQRLIH